MAKSDKETKIRPMRRHIFDNNWFVLLFSLVIAVILWFGVSMFQTVPVKKQFNSIKVQLNFEGSAPEKNGLKIIGSQDYSVDVTVRGQSYIVNADSFANRIVASVSFDTVTAPGACSLPVEVSASSSEVEVLSVSPASILVNIDQIEEREYDLKMDIQELENYSLPEGYTREAATLSVNTVKLQGPTMELNRISEVLAMVELNGELTATEQRPAELKIIPISENANIANVEVVESEEPVYITIPVYYNAKVRPTVSFKNAPKAFEETGLPYTVEPAELTVTVKTAEEREALENGVPIGEIDLEEIIDKLTFNGRGGVVNKIVKKTIPAQNLPYEFHETVEAFTVSVDMSGMRVRYLQPPVIAENITLPAGARILEDSRSGVQVIGPATTLDPINDNSVAYAVPVLDNISLQKGDNQVPVRIVLKSLPDCWVKGQYYVTVHVD